VATALHRARLRTVVHTLLASGARRVADLGCGRGELLQWLREHDQFTRLLGVDQDPAALAHARNRLSLDLLRPEDRLHVRLGSFEEWDWAEQDIDAAVLLETIEHVDPGRLPRVENAVFGQLRPAQVVVTTPNKEYNSVHGLASHERRHPGHRFEWTRARFQEWCNGVAGRRGYRVVYRDIGDRHPALGSSTQMASFLINSGRTTASD
jgi:small RNA 2'-O-methyltransferase